LYRPSNQESLSEFKIAVAANGEQAVAVRQKLLKFDDRLFWAKTFGSFSMRARPYPSLLLMKLNRGPLFSSSSYS
jgi:hypothetical protein